jgi:lipopolysaccharide/colanic/teichoic acid biosynthesis glycosyltransferase
MLYQYIKSLADKTICTLVLLLFFPIILTIMLILSITGEGEVFYKQKRIGYKNRTFYIYKFATMLKNSPQIGSGAVTIKNDPRVTFIGKYLRKSKLNELPQLVNVIKGDMSIVGPRPVDDFAFQAYTPEIVTCIYDLKPGITGIGSIVFRDEEKIISKPEVDPKKFYQTNIAPYKGALELWYQKNVSFATDIAIILLTVWQILFPNSAFVYRVFKTLPPKPIAFQPSIVNN